MFKQNHRKAGARRTLSYEETVRLLTGNHIFQLQVNFVLEGNLCGWPSLFFPASYWHDDDGQRVIMAAGAAGVQIHDLIFSFASHPDIAANKPDTCIMID